MLQRRKACPQAIHCGQVDLGAGNALTCVGILRQHLTPRAGNQAVAVGVPAVVVLATLAGCGTAAASGRRRWFRRTGRGQG